MHDQFMVAYYIQHYGFYLGTLALACAVAFVFIAYGRGFGKGYAAGEKIGRKIGHDEGYAAGRAPYVNHKRGVGGRFIKNTGE